MTTPDPIAEIKAIRHRLGAAFDYDLDRIFTDIQRRQAESRRTYVTLPPRRIANSHAMHGSGEAARSEVENQSSPHGDR